MQATTWTLAAGAVAAAALVAMSASRRPVLVRMAARNAARRPRQTATVIAGLMVGTAIMSAALVAGDSAGYAIRGYVYQSMGHIDEAVALPGYPYFTSDVYTSLQQAGGPFDGITALAVWEGTADNPRTDLWEPSVFLVGFDTATTAGFGSFRLEDGSATDGSWLGPGRAIISDHAADALGAREGDRITIAFTPPVDPAVPEVSLFAGNITSAGPTLPLGLPDVRSAVHTFDVAHGATRITIVAGSDPRVPASALPTRWDIELRDPQGTVVGRASGAGGPLWINATATPEQVLEEGTYQVAIRSDAAVQAAYAGAFVAGYPVYDLARLHERAQAWGDRGQSRPDGLEGFDPFSRRTEVMVEVAAVASGGRIDQFDFRSVLYMPLEDMQAALGREGQVNYVAFSNPGGIRSGVDSTDEAMRAIETNLHDIKARYDHPAVAALRASPEKQEFLRVADEAGQTMTGLLVFAGSLSIITGMLLIVNIFTMLAEERRSELGMARAVGMSRRDIVRLFVYEGSLYAVASAAIGAVAGLGLAYIMVWAMNRIVAGLGAGLSIPPITFQPSLDAVVAAFSAGALLTFATIWAASRRQGRINIVRAIRRIEEPERAGGLRRALLVGLPLLAAGSAGVAVGWMPGLHFTGRFSLQVFAPLAAAAGAALLAAPWVPRRRLQPALAAVLLLYYAVTMFTITSFDNLEEANLVGPMRGVALALCVVVLIVHFEAGTRALGRLLARIPAMRATAIPAVSYPLWKKFRTGMTLAMFAIVILSIGFFSIFGALFDSDPARQTGGFDVEARATLAVEDLDAYDRGLVDPSHIAARHDLVDFISEDPGFITVEGSPTGRLSDFRHHVYGFDAGFASDNGFRLLWRDDAYPTDQAAYQAVLDRDDAVIVSYIYSTDGANRDLANEVGDRLEMHLGDEVLQFTIIGIQEQFHHTAIWLPRDVVEGMFPTVEGLHLLRSAPGIEAADLARDLERNYRDVGLDAVDAEAEVLREQESFRQILSAMKLFLALGLVVGVLSLGIVTARSVLERRQEIGMLRALGFTPGQVRTVFLVEVTYTLLLGALAGVGCAILVTYGLWHAVVRELRYPYVIPWAEIALLVAIAYIVALLATAAPIRRAARVSPAEALRYVE